MLNLLNCSDIFYLNNSFSSYFLFDFIYFERFTGDKTDNFYFCYCCYYLGLLGLFYFILFEEDLVGSLYPFDIFAFFLLSSNLVKLLFIIYSFF